MTIQIQLLTAYLLLRERAVDAVRRVRDDERGELTGSVVLLAALAVAAAAVAIVIVARINSNAERIPE